MLWKTRLNEWWADAKDMSVVVPIGVGSPTINKTTMMRRIDAQALIQILSRGGKYALDLWFLSAVLLGIGIGILGCLFAVAIFFPKTNNALGAGSVSFCVAYLVFAVAGWLILAYLRAGWKYQRGIP